MMGEPGSILIKSWAAIGDMCAIRNSDIGIWIKVNFTNH